jgi:hypothetical protein
MRAEQYNLHKPHRPITGFKICYEQEGGEEEEEAEDGSSDL